MDTFCINNLIIILFFIAIIGIIWHILIGQYHNNNTATSSYNNYKPNNIDYTENFEDGNKENLDNTSEILTKMAQQLETIDAADRHVASDQISHYIASPDIVRTYRTKTEEMLKGLQQQVDTHSIEKRKQLDRLNTYLINLQEFVDADFIDRQRQRKITAIKSHNNGQELAIIPTTHPTNPGRVHNSHYLISINGGCIQVSENNNYEIVPRNPDNKDQKFKLEMIYNETSYRNAIAPGFTQLTSIGNVRYPFALLRATSNGNCLRNYHGRISVEPCREHEGQRWGIIEETMLPKCM